MLESKRVWQDGLTFQELRMRQLRLVPACLTFLVVTLLAASLSASAADGSGAATGASSHTNDPSASQPGGDLRPALAPTTSASSPTQSDGNSPDSGSKKVQPIVVQKFNYKKAFKDGLMAKKIARYPWLDKAAQANPELIEAVTWHHGAAKLLANHPRLGDIADGDHYLCRRLTRWRDVSYTLARNGQADRVIARDPEGMFRAISRWPGLGKELAKNPLFNQMINDVPDLADVLAQHM